MARHTKNPAGLTLIELMLSLALSTVLIVGVMESLTRLSHQDKQLAGESQEEWRLQSLHELLERDLLPAGEVSFQGQRLSLKTVRSIDTKDGLERQLPVKVSYQTMQKDGHSWLVRQEQLLTSEQMAVSSELVGSDMAILSVQGASAEGANAKMFVPAAGQGSSPRLCITAVAGKKTEQWFFTTR